MPFFRSGCSDATAACLLAQENQIAAHLHVCVLQSHQVPNWHFSCDSYWSRTLGLPSWSFLCFSRYILGAELLNMIHSRKGVCVWLDKSFFAGLCLRGLGLRIPPINGVVCRIHSVVYSFLSCPVGWSSLSIIYSTYPSVSVNMFLSFLMFTQAEKCRRLVAVNSGVFVNMYRSIHLIIYVFPCSCLSILSICLSVFLSFYHPFCVGTWFAGGVQGAYATRPCNHALCCHVPLPS